MLGNWPQKPFVAEPKPAAASPAASDALTYDQYRDIRFRPDHSLWRDEKLPFEVQFFHPGFVNTETVKIHEVTADGASRAICRSTRPTSTTATTRRRPRRWPSGYSGFRVHFPINNAAHKDEVIVFQGASYFRAVGKDQRYGLSARGLAVDTVGAGAEEFPRFTEFWLEKPAANADLADHHRADGLEERHRRLPLRRHAGRRTPSSTCSRACTCARTSRRWASPRSPACSSRARTSRSPATSAPRCTTPTA